MGKKWWQSKTIWTNVAAIIGALVAAYTTGVSEEEVATMVLGVINIILRFITQEPIT